MRGYWYDVGGVRTARASVAKLAGGFQRLMGGQGDATLVAVAAEYSDRRERAGEALERFLTSYPVFIHPSRLIARGELPE